MKRVLFPVTGLALAACLWGCEVNIENPGVAGDAGNNGGADVTPNNSTNNNGNNGNNNNSNNGNNDTPDAGNNDRVDLGHDDMGNPISNDEWPCKDLGIEKERCQGGAEWDAYEGDQALIDRGEYLALHVAACTDCHTPLTADFMPQEGCESWWSIRACDAPMSGWNTPFYDLAPEIEGVGAIGIPAITPHPDALGEWTPEELRMAFTKGIRPEWYTERPRIMIPYMPYNQFFHLTKEDEDAIIAYLHSIPPSPPVVTEFDEREPMEAGSVWEKFDTLEPADLDGDGVLDGLGGPTPTSGMPAITLDATDPNFEKAEHGRYLTEIACASCHTPALAPDPTLEGEDLLAQYNFREPSLTLAGSVEARSEEHTSELQSLV